MEDRSVAQRPTQIVASVAGCMNQTDRPFAGELVEPSIAGRTPSDPELVERVVEPFAEQLGAPFAECTPSDLEIAASFAGRRPFDPELIERIVEKFAG